MENVESLREYLSYANNEQTVVSVFSQLDQQLKLIHQAGYYVPIINSDSIRREGDMFVFNELRPMDDRYQNVSSNVVGLTKLAVGAFVATHGNQFYDYTHLDSSYLKDNFNNIEFIFPVDSGFGDYYRKVLVDEETTEYLSDHISFLQDGTEVSNARTFVKATSAGMALSDRGDDAGFIRIVFYPILIALVLTFIYVVANIV